MTACSSHQSKYRCRPHNEGTAVENLGQLFATVLSILQRTPSAIVTLPSVPFSQQTFFTNIDGGAMNMVSFKCNDREQCLFAHHGLCVFRCPLS